MTPRFPHWMAIVILAVPALAHAAESPPSSAGSVEFFEKKIRPLLADNCYNCHSANTNSQGGLRVDDRNGLLAGGGKGPAVVPGQPDKSLILRAVRYTDKNLQMPPKKQLTEEQVADLTKWIADGAAWPAVVVPDEIGKPRADYDQLRKEHWAWQPFGGSEVPQPRDAAWARDDIDRFILAALENRELKPVDDAGKLDLLRRVTFDLTGLPPTLEEIDAFVADTSTHAFETVVDRLLASRAFGERWGRHWLDVARYGESTGSSRNVPYPHAWRYRDYVIDAFNNDKPYDRFIREQIAGDLLPYESPEQREEHLVATGFLALGVKDVNQRFKVRFIMDNIDEQIDAVSRATLGLTASCARCHDHKFDPIPTTDYYALAGIFHSTDLCAGVRNKMGGGGLDYYDTDLLLRLDPDAKLDPELAAKIEERKTALKEARAQLVAVRDDPEKNVPGSEEEKKLKDARQKVNKIQAEVVALTDPAVIGKVALGVRDGKEPHDTEVRVRGEAEKLGPVVSRGFLGLLRVPEAAPVNTAQSGRLELAQWLTSEKNPLAQRVIVNRVWHYLFSQGLVRTVDNFGTTGDVPSHPDLLDHLARRFVRDGWSIKKLVRTLVLTHAYRLSAEARSDSVAVDPANRFLWRHSPRRLEAEEIRDATLALSGALISEPAEASVAKNMKVIELLNNGPEARKLEEESRSSQHRSVYLPLLRGITPTSLQTFDFAEQGMVTGSRDVTTVAPQALYLLNDPFVRKQSLALAENLLMDATLDESARITQAYRLTVGRPATTTEIERTQRYLAEYAATVADAFPDASIAVAELPANEDSAKSAPSATGVGNGKAKGKGKKKQQQAAAGNAGETAPAGQAKANNTKPQPAVPVNPDEADQTDAPVREESVHATDARTAAWASFCQALLGSAEFRYLR